MLNEDKTFNIRLEITDKEATGMLDIILEPLKNETDYNSLFNTLDYLNLIDEEDKYELEDFMEWYNSEEQWGSKPFGQSSANPAKPSKSTNENTTQNFSSE